MSDVIGAVTGTIYAPGDYIYPADVIVRDVDGERRAFFKTAADERRAAQEPKVWVEPTCWRCGRELTTLCLYRKCSHQHGRPTGGGCD